SDTGVIHDELLMNLIILYIDITALQVGPVNKVMRLAQSSCPGGTFKSTSNMQVRAFHATADFTQMCA
ncbi:hypothetical protein ACQP3J_29475, partial [Escherichia coli]